MFVEEVEYLFGSSNVRPVQMRNFAVIFYFREVFVTLN